MYIAKKYNSSNDIIYTFDYCMNNSLFTFKTIALYENSTNSVNEDVTRPYSDLILSSTVTDNIGPVNLRINGSYFWSGGNHLYTDSMMVKHKTAETTNVSVSINDSIYTGDFSIYTVEVKISVKNNLFNPPKLPLKVTSIIETVDYFINNTGIEVLCEHEMITDNYIAVYYGMQSANSANQEKIFIINSQYPQEIDKIDGIYSGAIGSYPDVYKVILSNSNKTICQEMMLDLNGDIYSNIENFISGSYSHLFTSGSKTYFHQIRNKFLSQGEHYFWKGRYSWYDLNELTIIPPGNIYITHNQSEIKLAWNDSPGAIYYKIYSSQDPYSDLFEYYESPVPKYYDDDLEPNKKFYRVTGLNYMLLEE
ncbi:MAG TPA: hypothetical protein PLK90_06110 [Clostridiales bacterium]|nr:hypothetical protein [Clostridiales bacterium]HQP69956.1 hypothetical protein [Clostridiales bacterium]